MRTFRTWWRTLRLRPSKVHDVASARGVGCVVLGARDLLSGAHSL